MTNFVETNKLCSVNAFFKKNEKRKRTWRSTNFEYRNDNYIFSNNLNTVQNVAVLNTVNNGSDHLLVRGILNIKVAIKRPYRDKCWGGIFFF